MSWEEVSETVCPMARCLSVVGDRWTLLIMRELSMGVHRFDELQAQTGMSSFLLSTRLKRLEEDGVIEKRPYNKRPLRYEYYPTEKGHALDEVLLLLRSWGMQHGGYKAGEEPAVKLVHKRTKKVVDADWRPPSGKPFRLADLDSTLSKAFAAEREKKRLAFAASRRGDGK